MKASLILTFCILFSYNTPTWSAEPTSSRPEPINIRALVEAEGGLSSFLAQLAAKELMGDLQEIAKVIEDGETWDEASDTHKRYRRYRTREEVEGAIRHKMLTPSSLLARAIQKFTTLKVLELEEKKVEALKEQAEAAKEQVDTTEMQFAMVEAYLADKRERDGLSKAPPRDIKPVKYAPL